MLFHDWHSTRVWRAARWRNKRLWWPLGPAVMSLSQFFILLIYPFFFTTFYLFCSPVWLGSFTDWKSNGNSLPLFLGLSRSRLPRSFSLTWCVSLVTSLFWFGSLIFHSGFTSIGSFLLRVVYWIDGKFDRLDSIWEDDKACVMEILPCKKHNIENKGVRIQRIVSSSYMTDFQPHIVRMQDAENYYDSSLSRPVRHRRVGWQAKRQPAWHTTRG